VVIFILMMATASLGYVVLWEQMSFWSATVITNLLSGISIVGESIVYWLWGDFLVGNATLNRFSTLLLIVDYQLTPFDGCLQSNNEFAYITHYHLLLLGH